MDLEGTRHEKAVLIIITFIIGFTCGLIAFGIRPHLQETVTATPDLTAPTTIAPATSESDMPMPPADMSDYVPPTENPPMDPMTEANEIVSYEEGKLYANVDGDRFLLSLQTEIMEGQNVEGFSTQGLHESLPVYSASPSGNFVYFCEQQTTEPVCVNFIFSVLDNKIYFVNNNGAKVVTPIDRAVLAVWGGDSLVVDGFRSVSDTTPWLVAALAE